MRELSLFTGAGGGLLGSMLLGFRTVAAVEIDPYCQRVLCARGGYVADADNERHLQSGEVERAGQAELRGVQAPFPVHADVRTFHPVPGSCDIVTGGFPCQPFSQAGKRLGEDDPRNMWPHAVRVLRESGAPLGFFENVPGLLSSGYFGTVLGDLAEAGFDAEWCVLGADDVGAPHRRKRLWILAYSAKFCDTRRLEAENGKRGRSLCQSDRDGLFAESAGGGSPWWCDPADVGEPDVSGFDDSLGPQRHRRERASVEAGNQTAGRDEWLLEPHVGRVATGVASRVDRLRALGNGQVPQCMAAAFTYLAKGAGVVT